MSNLRAVQLSKQNPQGEYIVFDRNIPHETSKQLSHDIPNLHFIQGILSPNLNIPFQDNSMDRVEMNFLYTPLTDPDGKGMPSRTNMSQQLGWNLFGTAYTELYVHTLEEACRALKPGGILAITEKQQRLNWIKRLLSRDSWLDLDGSLMNKLGLDTGPSPCYTTEEIIDPTTTYYTERAIQQREMAKKEGDTKKESNLKVFRMEVRKKK